MPCGFGNKPGWGGKREVKVLGLFYANVCCVQWWVKEPPDSNQALETCPKPGGHLCVKNTFTQHLMLEKALEITESSCSFSTTEVPSATPTPLGTLQGW